LPRFLAVGHVTWDRREGENVLGGSASYATLAALRLGWTAGCLTSASPADFEATQDLPGVAAFLQPASATTRFEHFYQEDGTREQFLLGRADPIELTPLPDAWRDPEVLLLCPVAGELEGSLAPAFVAGCVGAIAQGWLREVDRAGRVSPRDWAHPEHDLAGVHVLFLSEHDLPRGAEQARNFLDHVPIVACTRGWRGLTLHTRTGALEVPAYPRPEVDPTGAGDVFAAAFLLNYHETEDPLAAAVFGACAASCVVEGVGTASLGDRKEVLRRVAARELLLEEGEGEWDE
jgi:sugar/nucleoside kinase (ribokinase family)